MYVGNVNGPNVLPGKARFGEIFALSVFHSTFTPALLTTENDLSRISTREA